MASTSCLSTGGTGKNIRWVPLDIKIMIIDEDPTSLLFVGKVLETCHYKVELYENPVNALHVLGQRKEEYDLVIMDLDCIAMPGFDLLEIIAKKMNVSVITTCYDGREKIRTQAICSGACSHIVKPIIIVNSLEFVWTKEWKCSVKRKESKKQLNGRDKVDSTSNNMSGDELGSKKHPKTRLYWDEKLHERFLVAVSLLRDEATSKNVLGIMNVEGLTVKEVSSHLQKHKRRLQKEKENNFAQPILPLQQFPTSINPVSCNMANTTHDPMVIEDEKEWTLDELLGINDAPEPAQHDLMVDSSNVSDIDFDFVSEFLDFDFENNNFMDESEAAQRGLADSSNGCHTDFDFVSEFLEFDFENQSFLDDIFNDTGNGGM